MKKVIYIAAMFAFLLAGCKTQQSALQGNDDVYYQSKKTHASQQTIVKDEDLSAPKQVTATDTTVNATAAKSGWYDDYTDYSARIKRFQHPTENAGYYDESYVDTTQQANESSSSPDVNIYLGGGWGYPYCGSSFSMGFGWGWGWNDWYWNWGWSYPYYGWYYPYSSWYSPYWWYYPGYGWPYPGDYWFGYWNGYWNGYWDGYYPYPYPYYSSIYGPRRDMITHDGLGYYGNNIRNSGGGAATAQAPNDRTGAVEKNERVSGGESRSVPSAGDAGVRSDAGTAIRSGSGGTSGERSTVIQPEGTSARQSPAAVYQRPETKKTPPDQQRYIYSRSKDSQASPYQRNNQGTVQRENATPKYVRPENVVTETRNAETQLYTPPSYRQPKSSQEYLTPRGQGMPENTGTTYQRSSTGNSTPRTYGVSPGTRSTPRTYSSPSNTRSYSPPSRSYTSPGYSAPSRSYTPSYSSPSRSSGDGGSYSSPSRSSGGGGGGSTGGSGGGGGGRRR